MARMIKERIEQKDIVYTAVAYVRVSTPSQARAGVSLEMQREKILEYCNNPQNKCILDPKRIYVDKGKSAYKHPKQRIGYKNAKKDIELGRANTLVIYSLSRAFRSVKECVATMELLQGCDGHIISVTEPAINTTTKMGKFVYNLFGALAEFESDQTSERVTDNMLMAFEKNRFLGGRRPTGYEFVKKDVWVDKKGQPTKVNKVVEPFYIKHHNGERETVDKIFEMYRKGIGQNKIAEETGLNKCVIGWILSSPTYCGYLLWTTQSGEYRIRKGSHESYITVKQYNRNVDRRINRSKNGYLRRKAPFKVYHDKDGKPHLKFVKA